MDEALSYNEREALSRYVSRLIDDVDKLAALFERRGGDATLPRSAQANLVRTLDGLQLTDRSQEPA